MGSTAIVLSDGVAVHMQCTVSRACQHRLYLTYLTARKCTAEGQAEQPKQVYTDNTDNNTCTWVFVAGAATTAAVEDADPTTAAVEDADPGGGSSGRRTDPGGERCSWPTGWNTPNHALCAPCDGPA